MSSKASGGTRGGASGHKKSNGFTSGETEKGHSVALAKNILKAEKEISGNKNETVIIFDDDGNETFRKEGTRQGVSYPGKYGTNKIMTHNHPGPDAPFSSSDLRDAVLFNEKECRAASRNFTFSMKRPADGWGNVKPESVVRSYHTIRRQVAKEWESKFANVESGAPMQKAYFESQVEVQRRIAKKYGWDFSIKRNT